MRAKAGPEQKPAAAPRGGDRIVGKKPVGVPGESDHEVPRVPHAEGADADAAQGPDRSLHSGT